MTSDLAAWSVVAVNLPEHAANAIHTDAGARAAGFPAALVAGVTTYAYLCHVPLAAWGLDWLRTGGAELSLRAPVFAGDTLRCVPRVDDGRARVDATVVGRDPEVRASISVTPPLIPATEGTRVPPVLRRGEPLAERHIRLEGQWGADYATRAGDDLDLCAAAGVVHPAVWPSLANHIVHTQVARGSWIHLRSLVRHHALAPVHATAVVTATVVDRSVRRRGERAVLDVCITVDDVVVATLEHEALVDLGAGRDP